MKFASRKFIFAVMSFLTCAGVALYSLAQGHDIASMAAVMGTIATSYLAGQAYVDGRNS